MLDQWVLLMVAGLLPYYITSDYSPTGYRLQIKAAFWSLSLHSTGKGKGSGGGRAGGKTHNTTGRATDHQRQGSRDKGAAGKDLRLIFRSPLLSQLKGLLVIMATHFVNQTQNKTNPYN